MGWLANVKRFITRAEPLYDSLKPLVMSRFRAVVVCVRSLLLWSITSHDVDLSVFCSLLYLRYKPRSRWKIPSKQLSFFTLEKFCTICPRKFQDIQTGIFGRKVSAPGFSGSSLGNFRTIWTHFEIIGIFGWPSTLIRRSRAPKTDFFENAERKTSALRLRGLGSIFQNRLFCGIL